MSKKSSIKIDLKPPFKRTNRIVLFEKIRLKRLDFTKFAKKFENFIPDMNAYLDNVESNMERELIEVLKNIQVSASVKTQKKTLPYQHEIIFRLPSESYAHGMFEYSKMFRTIMRELLNKDCYKIRFYMHIEPYGEDATGFHALLGGQGIEYCFRYYIHNLSTI